MSGIMRTRWSRQAKAQPRGKDRRFQTEKVTGGTFDSAHGRNSELIETNNIVAHGIYRYAELGDDTTVSLAGTKTEKLGSSETLDVEYRRTTGRKR